MGKFSSKPNIQPLPTLSKNTKDTPDTTEEDKSADRLRLAEKRRRGRRSSILSHIGEEDIQASAFGRPAAAASNAINPPKNLFGS